MRSVLSALTVMSVLLAPSASRASPIVHVLDLGQLGAGQSGQANAVNACGDVAGYSCTAERCRAFRWTRRGGMVDLGDLGGTQTDALAITAFGSIVGYGTLAGDAELRPFIWSTGGGMTALPTTLDGGVVLPYAASDWGQVVGYGTLAAGGHHAFSWTPWEGFVDLGTPGGQYSLALGVGNGGHVVGYGSTAGDAATHAFCWTEEAGMVDLGTLGGPTSSAEAVSSSGQVVGGASLADGSTHAFSWTAEGGMVDLGTLAGGRYSHALAVNNRGQIVGTSDVGGGAFFWSPEDGMVPLGSLGGGGTYPHAISSSGQVVGVSSLLRGQGQHAFSWTRRGGMVDLGPLPGGRDSFALAVSATGVVVGSSTTGVAGEWRPVLWTIGR
jgi:probable HAF family extracellular repeat protein